MRIMSIQNNYCQPKTSFKSYDGFVRGTNRELFNIGADNCMYKINSELMRPSVGYMIKLFDFIKDFYKNIKKVNLYSYGCSYGSEPTSFLMTMLSFWNENDCMKMFPVIAKDINPMAIDHAKRGTIILDDYEINKCMNNSIDIHEFAYYMDDAKENMYGDPQYEYKLRPCIRKNIKYSVANILEDYKNIKPNNSIVSARNFWPYLRVDKQKELADKLSKQLRENSLLITGDFDNSYIYQRTGISKLVQDYGFKPISECDNVFINRRFN